MQERRKTKGDNLQYIVVATALHDEGEDGDDSLEVISIVFLQVTTGFKTNP